MGEFFSGWRRKWGIAALLIALMTATAWLRSKYVQESVFFTVSGQTYVAYSASGRVYLWKVDESLSHWAGWHPGIIPNSLRSYPFRPVVVGYWFLIAPLTVLSSYLTIWSKPKRSNVYLREV